MPKPLKDFDAPVATPPTPPGYVTPRDVYLYKNERNVHALCPACARQKRADGQHLEIGPPTRAKCEACE